MRWIAAALMLSACGTESGERPVCKPRTGVYRYELGATSGTCSGELASATGFMDADRYVMTGFDCIDAEPASDASCSVEIDRHCRYETLNASYYGVMNWLASGEEGIGYLVVSFWLDNRTGCGGDYFMTMRRP